MTHNKKQCKPKAFSEDNDLFSAKSNTQISSLNPV